MFSYNNTQKMETLKTTDECHKKYKNISESLDRKAYPKIVTDCKKELFWISKLAVQYVCMLEVRNI